MEQACELGTHYGLYNYPLKINFTRNELIYTVFYIQYTFDIFTGWQRIYHAGNVHPFHSELSFYPATNIGIFSSTNQMPVNPAIYHPHLHCAIFDILRGEDPSKIAEKFQTLNRDGNKAKFENKDVKTVVPSEEELDKYIGVYGNGLEGIKPGINNRKKVFHKIQIFIRIFLTNRGNRNYNKNKDRNEYNRAIHELSRMG